MPDSASMTGMRRSYARSRLEEADLAADWVTQFTRWFAEAVASGQLSEPNAMVVATATPDGRPSLRTVLLRGVDERGFVFYTNYESRKGRELAANPSVALLFSWVPLERQVVVTGTASRVSRAETEAYFRSRPRDSQLASWASPQSSVVPSRAVLDDALAELDRRWPDGAEIPAPEHWGGLRVAPDTVEFWQGRPARLHDRLRYRRAGERQQGRRAGEGQQGRRAGERQQGRRAGDGWLVERLAP